MFCQEHHSCKQAQIEQIFKKHTYHNIYLRVNVSVCDLKVYFRYSPQRKKEKEKRTGLCRANLIRKHSKSKWKTGLLIS